MFTKEDVIEGLEGHISQAIIFSANGTRIFSRVIIRHEPKVDFLVEILGKNNHFEIFDTLKEAARYAEENQR